MGIRIHRVLGYGLNKLPKSWYNEDTMQTYMGERFSSFLAWWKEHHADVVSYSKKTYPKDSEYEYLFLSKEKDRPFNHLVQPEGTNKLLFCPFAKWYEYDNVLDYYQHNGTNNGKILVKKLHYSGIYPYNGSVVAKEACPKELYQDMDLHSSKNLEAGVLSPYEYSTLTGVWDKKQKPTASPELLKHLKTHWGPEVPTAIVALVLWTEPVWLIPIQQVLNGLRPLMFTFWQ